MGKASSATKMLKFAVTLAVMFSLVGYVVYGIFLPCWRYKSDFSWYYYGAKVAAAGGDIYYSEELREAARAAGEPEELIEHGFRFTYPPFFAILMRPLLLFSHAQTRILWLFLNHGLFILAIILCIAALRERVSFFEVGAIAFIALNFNPVFRNFLYGQVNVATFFLLAAALYAFKRKAEGPAGALLGLATMIKVIPALFVLYFLYKRRWKVVIWAALTLIFLLIISVALLGIRPHRAYILRVMPLLAQGRGAGNNQSLAGFFNRLFGYDFQGEAIFNNANLARILSQAGALLFLLLSFLIIRQPAVNDRLRWNLDFSLFVLTAHIISPISWDFHLVWLMLPIITLIHLLFDRSDYHTNRLAYIFLFLAASIVLAWKFPLYHPALRCRALMMFISIKLYAMIIMWGLLGWTIRNLRRKACSVASPACPARTGTAREATNNPPNRSVATPVAANNAESEKYVPPYKTWGKSCSLKLREFDYSAPYIIYHITIGSFDRKNLFTKPHLNLLILNILKKSAPLYGYQLIAYCLLPDHIHILLQAKDNPKDLRKFVRGFKSYSTKEARRKLWQRGFYEHILRKEEKTFEIAKYILNNPVRKGLVEKMEEYPWGELLQINNDNPRPHGSEAATDKTDKNRKCSVASPEATNNSKTNNCPDRSHDAVNRPWLLIIVGLGAIVLAVITLYAPANLLIYHIRQGSLPENIWSWVELAVRLEAALFLCSGALGLWAMRKWGVISLWLSAFVLGSYWSGVGYYPPIIMWILGHLPLLIIPLFYWKRLTWKI